MNFLNPYSYIGGAIILAVIGGGFYYQDRQIHHWHTKYDTVQDENVRLSQKVKDMTTTQNTQTKKSEDNVTKIIQIPSRPEVKTIIKEIHDAPEPADCGTPTLPEGATL